MAYITPEEEFELQYADDFDVLSERENIQGDIPGEVLNLGNECEGVCSERNSNSACDNKRKSDNIEADYSGDIPGDVLNLENESGQICNKRSSNSSYDNKRNFESANIDADYSAAKRFKLFNKSPERTSQNCIHEVLSYTVKKSSDSLCVTKFDGSRVYLSYQEDCIGFEESLCSKVSNGLIRTSIENLKLSVLEKFKKSDCADEPNTDISASNNATELWVEKHRPRSFVELLSDEGVNRALLRWLKQWDKVVFGKEVVMKQRTATPVFNKFGQKFQKPSTQLQEELDEHNRPQQKIVLLCGPPGMGKTTLASVIAKVAGYNPIELNASDDRSVDVFRRSLEASTQMKAVLDKSKRPNCLIIDEIDGAPVPSINLLVAFTKSLGTSKGKKKKGEFPLLLRPIICICNDQYASALKPLRRIALILNFPPTSKNRLANRLFEVASFEGLKVDLTSLILLCEKTNNDIRSCLSTIQFLFNSKKKLYAADIRNLEIGVKDLHKSLFTVWQEILHAPKPKLCTEVSGTIQGFGDNERIFAGVFENYLKLKSKKSRLSSLSKSIDWLCLADIFQTEIYQAQNFILMGYLPFAGAAFNNLLASVSCPRLSYPSSYYECISKRSLSLSCLASIRQEIVLSIRNFFSCNCLIIDMLPLVVEILKPVLRAINPDLFTQKEKADLKRVVEVMLSINLNYIQERSLDGNYTFTLEPDIEKIVQFPLSLQKRELGYTVKQLIAREVSIEKMRRSESVEVFEKAEVKPQEEKEKKKTTKKTTRPIMQFFERKAITSEKEVQKVEIGKESNMVWFHFKEGYSNAIRRTVYMKDFM